MTFFTVDIAQPAKDSLRESAVATISHQERTVVALFDGWGSWGKGYEAAARALALAEERWRNNIPDSIEAAAQDIHDIANSTPASFHNEIYDCSFHGVTLLLSSSSIYVAAAGAYAVVHASPTGLAAIFKPQTFVEFLRSRHGLSQEQAGAYPIKNVYPGPYLANSNRSPLACSGPHDLPSESALIVANVDLLEKLSPLEPGAWLRMPAHALREFEEQRFKTPVVIVRRAVDP